MKAISQEKTEKVKNPRLASIELLRCIAMLMVITLHYLDKGGILVPITEKQTFAGVCAWALESLCIVAVNTYVLISGYFLVESGFKLRRLIIMIAQVLFYSILVPVVLIACGILPTYMLTIYNWINFFFPIEMNHYWFATAYILMYIFVPVLSAGVKQLNKKQLRTTIFAALTFYCFGKSFLPFYVEIDNWGYHMTWFLCLFLVAAYIRLYGVNRPKSSSRAFLMYVLSCVGILGLSFLYAYAYNTWDIFEGRAANTFNYNHILCLLGAIGLFLTFLKWEMPEGKFAAFIRKIAPYTFGVYLLHENVEIRHLWMEWLGTDKFADGTWSVFHWLMSIMIVFTAGIVIDYLRSLLFGVVERFINWIKCRCKKCEA